MSTPGFERDIPLVTVTYTAILARFLRRHGVETDVLLEGSGVAPAALSDPEAYLSIGQSEYIIERALELLPRPGLGFEYGLQLDLSAHGLLGFSVLRRASLRELTRMLVDFLRVRMPLMELRLQAQAGVLELQVEDSWPFDKARQFLVEAYIGSIYSLAASGFRDIELCFTFARPASAVFERQVRCPVLFSQKKNMVRMRLDRLHEQVTDRLDTPLYADQSARASLAYEEHCGIALRVRHCIMRDPGRHSTLEGVAGELGLSARSLRRHLQMTGSSFSDIRNSIRKQFALRYLRASSLTLDTIAERLGYGDQASFTRAFREWTGVSPGRYRRGEDIAMTSGATAAGTDAEIVVPLKRLVSANKKGP